MNSDLRKWGFWTEIKLDALDRYLARFTTASKRASTTVYLDLFAGSVDNLRRDDNTRHFTGSTVRAMETIPPFTHLRFFEVSQQALKLRSDLSARFPDDDRYVVIDGDCNVTISRALHDLRVQGLDFSPTFCFIDPDGLDVDWSTLSTVASFKNSRARTKPEMLILLSHTTIPRLAGWDSSMGLDEELSSTVTALYGTQGWRHIHNRRMSDGLGASDARTLYTELFRYRIQQVLGYRRTLTMARDRWRARCTRRPRTRVGGRAMRCAGLRTVRRARAHPGSVVGASTRRRCRCSPAVGLASSRASRTATSARPGGGTRDSGDRLCSCRKDPLSHPDVPGKWDKQQGLASAR